jgi:hypothetical protein
MDKFALESMFPGLEPELLGVAEHRLDSFFKKAASEGVSLKLDPDIQKEMAQVFLFSEYAACHVSTSAGVKGSGQILFRHILHQPP